MPSPRKRPEKTQAPSLREQAEARLTPTKPSVNREDVSAILHELRVHQTELEMQNQELRRAQQDLEASRNQYFTLFDLAPLPYLVLDPKHQLLDLNLAAAELVGVPRNRLKGRPFFPCVADSHREAFHQHLNQVFGDARPTVGECRLQRPDGELRWVRLHSQPMHAQPSATPLCLTSAVDFTQQRDAEEALRRSEVELEAIYDNAPIMMCLVNEHRQIERMNRAMAALIGRANSDPGTRNVHSSIAAHLGCYNALRREEGCGAGPQCERCPLREALIDTCSTGRPCRQIEGPLWYRRDGVWSSIDVAASTTLIPLEGKSHVLVCLEDITGRRQLQAQLLQAQKMEAIGQLAGGVAHDFNNILAATMMNLSMLRSAATVPSAAQPFLRELERGAERAASLTRQLLLFGRRQHMQTRPLDLNKVVASMLDLLRRVLGEHIQIHWTPADVPVWVEGDSGMLEQIVMNLCVNARDAMPAGGGITLLADRIPLTHQQTGSHEDARPGSFIRLTVSDAGTGMDAATLRRIFEPFFTTKEPGKGTGLGLATVYGIVKQHHGWIEVQSQPGDGTTFRVFLPEISAPRETPAPEPAGVVRGRGERILLVEDDEALRSLLAMTLRRYGYRVVEADDGPDAVRHWDLHAGAFDLVFTDMVMPGGMTGLDIVKELRQLKPRLRCVISSGYSLDLVHPDGIGNPGMRFLPKPYQPSALVTLIRECLDQPH
ncbi:MAG: PAS domain S-box protein [Verrucomicrobiae bacterium]|nr:PAS domain S-box protein [Verrucomicrobiae bacterium]